MMRLKIETVKKLLQESKRFSCELLYFFPNEDLFSIGYKISRKLNDTKIVLTVDKSGSIFYDRYIKQYVTKYHRRFIIDPKSSKITGDTMYLSSNKNIAIIDDVLETGDTLLKVFDTLKKNISLDETVFDIYVISVSRKYDESDNLRYEYEKKLDYDKLGIKFNIHPFYFKEKNEYIVFPWELE